MRNFFKLKAWRASSVIILGIAGLLFGPADSRSRAQQDPTRQLMHANEQRPNSIRRVALVIGNGAYTNAPPLKNPPNDARDMAANLKTLGFDVSSGVNLSQREMKRFIRDFGQKLKAGGNGLFYYAGHGVQARGRNYIIPVDADIQSEADVEDSGVDVGLVLNYMDDAQNGLNIVILDACRNNPFARSFRSAAEGLAQVDAPTGTLIAYATAPGRVAADGAGENGLYTSELLKAMRIPGLGATDMFMQVRREVMKRTGNKQVPWEASSLVGSFYFSAPLNSTERLPTGGTTGTVVDPAAFELSYWESIKNSTDPEDFKAYLEKYPRGQFAALAKNKLRILPTSIRDAETDAGGSQNSQPPSGAVSGGILNDKAVKLIQPSYPPIARASRASGQVQVQVLVDENGNVITAQAISGHILLQAVSVAAASASKFSPMKVAGQPVKVNGIVVYNFVPE
jgi:TonB family protein